MVLSPLILNVLLTCTLFTLGLAEEAEQENSFFPLETNANHGSRLLSRDTRSTSEDNLSEDEIRLIVDGHNDYRRQEGASDMEYMGWNTELARMSRDYVKECRWGHSSMRRRGYNITYNMVGENLHYTSGIRNLSRILILWYEEKANYNYTGRYCTPNTMCTHYTQLVWAPSWEIGCGITVCANFTKGNRILHNIRYFGCNYGVRGNYGGKRPYLKGAACTQCPLEKPWCKTGLCYQECADPSCQSSSISHLPRTTTTASLSVSVTPTKSVSVAPTTRITMTSPHTSHDVTPKPMTTKGSPVNCSHWICQHGGTPSIKDGLCACNCQEDYRGENCQYSKQEEDLGIVLNFIGHIVLWSKAWQEVKRTLVTSVNLYCKANPEKCCGKGTSYGSGSFLNTSQLILGTGYPREENFGDPGFAVLILARHNPNNGFCLYEGGKRQPGEYISRDTLYDGLMYRKDSLVETLLSCCNLTIIVDIGTLPVTSDPSSLAAWKQALIAVFTVGAILLLAGVLLVYLRRHNSFSLQFTQVLFKSMRGVDKKTEGQVVIKSNANGTDAKVKDQSEK